MAFCGNEILQIHILGVRVATCGIGSRGIGFLWRFATATARGKQGDKRNQETQDRDE